MMDDDGFDDFVDVCLAGHGVLPVGDVHEGGPKADGQVVGVHHVLVAVLREATREEAPHVTGERRSLPLRFLSLGDSVQIQEDSMFCFKNSCTCRSLRTPLPKGGQGQVKEGTPWPGNSLIEESEEISHDHDDHTGKGDEDLLDLVHPLSGALQFCNIKGLSGCPSSLVSQLANICESYLFDQPMWFRGASSTLSSGSLAWPIRASYSPGHRGGPREGYMASSEPTGVDPWEFGLEKPERGALLNLDRGKSGVAGGS